MGKSPVTWHKGQWHEALMHSLICAWINSWVNNGEAGVLRCHRAHYDVTVMINHSVMLYAPNELIQAEWCIYIYIYISKLTIIGSEEGWLVPSHYLNQCWNIVNWPLRNKLQWNVDWNAYIFIQRNAFENVIWKMVAILSQPQYVKYVDTYASVKWSLFEKQ